jgi:hypothetical protein
MVQGVAVQDWYRLRVHKLDSAHPFIDQAHDVGLSRVGLGCWGDDIRQDIGLIKVGLGLSQGAAS